MRRNSGVISRERSLTKKTNIGMPKPRIHHFVQAAHIRQFVGEDGMVSVYAKDGQRFRLTPEAIFRQRDLNSYETEDGEISTVFEEVVTDFENGTFPALLEIIENGRIVGSNLDQLTAYIALSRLRNPSIQRGVHEMYQKILTSTAKILDKTGAFDEGYPPPKAIGAQTITEMLEKGIVNFEINNSKYIEAMSMQIYNVQKVLLKGFRWSLVKSTRGRVLISDHPFTYVHPGEDPGPYGIVMGGKSCEAAFPLSSNLYAFGVWERQIDDFVSEDAVDELNKRQAIFANRHIASGVPRRRWSDLISRHRHYGLRSVTDSLPIPKGSYEISRIGIYPIDSRKRWPGKHPLTTTRRVAPRSKA